jgi:hypothetical protein
MRNLWPHLRSSRASLRPASPMAYISEEGHLCPWGDRRRSAIIAQTSVKHGGGVAINLGFLKDSGAWDQDFYVARPGAMGAGQKASILISRANGRTMTVSCLRG